MQSRITCTNQFSCGFFFLDFEKPEYKDFKHVMMDEFYNNFQEFNEATKTELVNFIKSKTTAWISMSNSFELVSSCSTRELLLEPANDETKEDSTEALKNMIKKQLKNSVKVATTSMLSKRFMKFLENDFDKSDTNLLSPQVSQLSAAMMCWVGCLLIEGEEKKSKLGQIYK